MSRRDVKNMTADQALEIIGDDPQTLVLAIRLLERMRWQREQRARRLPTKARRA